MFNVCQQKALIVLHVYICCSTLLALAGFSNTMFGFVLSSVLFKVGFIREEVFFQRSPLIDCSRVYIVWLVWVPASEFLFQSSCFQGGSVNHLTAWESIMRLCLIDLYIYICMYIHIIYRQRDRHIYVFIRLCYSFACIYIYMYVWSMGIGGLWERVWGGTGWGQVSRLSTSVGLVHSHPPPITQDASEIKTIWNSNEKIRWR